MIVVHRGTSIRAMRIMRRRHGVRVTKAGRLADPLALGVHPAVAAPPDDVRHPIRGRRHRGPPGMIGAWPTQD
jgi:hypothetical protein